MKPLGRIFVLLPIVVVFLYGKHQWGLRRGPESYHVPVPPGAVLQDHKYRSGRRSFSQKWTYSAPGSQVDLLTRYYVDELPKRDWTLEKNTMKDYGRGAHGWITAHQGWRRLTLWVRPPDASVDATRVQIEVWR